MSEPDEPSWIEEDEDPGPSSRDLDDARLREEMRDRWKRISAGSSGSAPSAKPKAVKSNASESEAPPTLEFLDRAGLPISVANIGRKRAEGDDSFFTVGNQIILRKNISTRGNAWYDFAKSAISLPAGLDTAVRINGVLIQMSAVYESGRGNPTRRGAAEILVGTTRYAVSAFLTETSSPYWIKIVALRARNQTVPDDDMVGSTEGRSKSPTVDRLSSADTTQDRATTNIDAAINFVPSKSSSVKHAPESAWRSWLRTAIFILASVAILAIFLR